MVPEPVWGLAGIIGGAYLTHRHLMSKLKADSHHKKEGREISWLEMELEHLASNHSLLQENLNKSIERLDEDRRYQDEKIKDMREQIQELEDKHDECQERFEKLMEDHIVLHDKYQNLAQTVTRGLNDRLFSD